MLKYNIRDNFLRFYIYFGNISLIAQTCFMIYDSGLVSHNDYSSGVKLAMILSPSNITQFWHA
jgi:hypothetical protein